LGVLVLPAGGVDCLEFEPQQAGVTQAPVARHAGPVVDQRQLLADQSVEQRRLADIWPADDDHLGKGACHAAQVAAKGAIGKLYGADLNSIRAELTIRIWAPGSPAP